MDLQTLVGRVRKTLGEVEPDGYGSQGDGDGSWDNSQIIGYLNEALEILSHDWRKEKSGSIAVTSVGQTDFDFPADCLEDGLRSVIYQTADGTSFPMTYVPLDDYIRRSYQEIPTPTGVPLDMRIYTVWAGKIKIYPGATNTTDTLVPYYFRSITQLANATDVPEIPIRFHQVLIFYALRECQNAVEEVNLEFDADQKWEAERVRFRAEMSKNQRDQGIRARGRR